MKIGLDSLRSSLESLRDQPDRLIEIILQQAGRMVEMEAEMSALKQRLSDLEQKPPGSTAPFRIEDRKRVSNPKKPGRKGGHKGSYRRARLETEQITIPLLCCPNCGGELENIQSVKQIIEEIPPVELRVVGLTTFKGCCAKCGEVRSAHPLQVSTAVGAAGVHLGPNALSILLQFQHSWHLTKRKSCRILDQLFGLSITPGGLVSATHRLAKKLKDNYQALKEQARSAAVLHSDETSWYVGRPGHTLWVFTNAALTLYRVVGTRNRDELQETVGKNFSGVLLSDCLSIYDDATPIQHKCYSHHLKAISKAIGQHPQGEGGFLNEVKVLLKTAMAIKELKNQTKPKTYQQWCENLERRADTLLLSKPRGQPQEEAVRNRLFKQRDHLFTFLYHDQVDATNNLAERQLRPAVIVRKISCGNRTPKGAETWEILASLATTCAQTGQSFGDLITKVLALDPVPGLAR